MKVRGKTYELSPGACFMIRMWEPCSARHDAEHPLTVLWTFLRCHGGRHREDELPPVHRHIRDLTFFSLLYKKVLSSSIDPFQEKTCAQHWMRAVLLALDDEDRAADSADADPRSQKIKSIAARIQDEPGANHRVESLARECACSPGHFTRLFRNMLGTTPGSFIVNTRIDAARSLLRGSSQQISRIADDLGYGDVFHFSKQFKGKTGMSPSDYRRT